MLLDMNPNGEFDNKAQAMSDYQVFGNAAVKRQLGPPRRQFWADSIQLSWNEEYCNCDAFFAHWYSTPGNIYASIFECQRKTTLDQPNKLKNRIK